MQSIQELAEKYADGKVLKVFDLLWSRLILKVTKMATRSKANTNGFIRKQIGWFLLYEGSKNALDLLYAESKSQCSSYTGNHSRIATIAQQTGTTIKGFIRHTSAKAVGVTL